MMVVSMRVVGLAVALAAAGIFVDFSVIYGLGLDPFSLAAMIVRCIVLTPSAVWIDWHLPKTVPSFMITVMLWVTLLVTPILIWVVVPYRVTVSYPAIAVLVLETMLVLTVIGVPGIVIPVGVYLKSHFAPKSTNVNQRGTNESDS